MKPKISTHLPRNCADCEFHSEPGLDPGIKLPYCHHYRTKVPPDMKTCPFRKNADENYLIPKLEKAKKRYADDLRKKRKKRLQPCFKCGAKRHRDPELPL